MTSNDESMVDIIAYYLPQYYPMRLNSKYWGEGYTEWNAVVAAQRGWRSHSKSRLTPGELGFYDLRSKETRRAQANLAKEHGIAAFAIYHYWSAGDRVMPEVVDRMLSDGEPHLPFFFCWANHDWTLAWQGDPSTVTWAQRYNETTSDAHIDWLLSVFDSPQYYKIDGCPVIQIFAPLDVPNLKDVLDRWRERATSRGFPGLVVLGVSPSVEPPTASSEYGLDAWVQSPGKVVGEVPRWKRALHSVDSPMSALRLLAYGDYTYSSAQIGDLMRRARRKVAHSMVPTVICTWNNSGRRKRGAWSMDTSVDEFRKQVLDALVDAPRITPPNRTSGKRLVLINAWNEWGEAMSLEPSVEHGRAFLEAVAGVQGGVGGRVSP